jgi:cytochrome P450
MSAHAAIPPVQRPPHVPAGLERAFDLYAFPGSAEDVHRAMYDLQQTMPEIFWTPYNGGHWVATRASDIIEMQLDHKHFSHSKTALPPMPAETPPVIPIELDPPGHADYRRPLMQLLRPGIVAELDAKVRQVAIDAIEALLPVGECEFVGQFSRLVSVADSVVRSNSVEDRTEAFRKMAEYLAPVIDERRASPGSDLLSAVVNVEVEGLRIDVSEASSYASLVLFAGLDTVASMLGFIALFLAQHPQHRRQLIARIDDKEFLRRAIEELIRRHSLSSTARTIAEDYEYKNLQFKAGEKILPIGVLIGLDQDLNPDPLTVDFDREKPVHGVFGNGPHACPGASLARREIRIFLEEWLARIPDFSVKPGTRPEMATGMISSIHRLELVFS